MEELLKVSKALADPIRLEILRILSNPAQCCSEVYGPGLMCVCEFTGKLDMQQSKVSYHLGVLKEAGLVIEEPRGKWSYYRLNRGEIQAYVQRLQGLVKT